MINILVLLIALHFIADFPFQGAWLGVGKATSWELMVYHCLIYAGTFVVFAQFPWQLALVLFLSHLIIDPLKARYKVIKHIWIDQLLHLAVLAAIALYIY